METMVPDFVVRLAIILAVLFIVAICLGAVTVTALYLLDITQTRHAIRRNYPVIGRFRYYFEHLGTFFRQYFFAMDREELPFNREQRSYIYRAAKDLDTTVAFGSTRDLRPIGTLIFVNSSFPILDEDSEPPRPIIIGPYCEQPYSTSGLFNISGMSYGAISKVAIRALSDGAREAGAWLNTGEGGLSPYHLEGGCDIVFQMGTAKYGARDATGALSDDKLREIAGHDQVRMIEVKLSQGAKPGKGGILPGAKVTAEIAAIRGIPQGQDSISPNRHLDVKSGDDLLDLIDRIRRVTGKPVGFKSVIGEPRWLAALFAKVHERGIESAPDFITVDSGDGGTGAAPLSLMDNVGLTLHESLPMVVDLLVEWGLRDRVKVIASGKLVNPAEVAWAYCVGADFVVSARGFMFALGCIQAMQCNKNTCPTGITTHDPHLQKGLDPVDKATRVAHYIKNLTHEIEVISHSCGVTQPRDLARHHARIVTQSGRSQPIDDLYPDHIAGAALAEVATANTLPSD